MEVFPLCSSSMTESLNLEWRERYRQKNLKNLLSAFSSGDRVRAGTRKVLRLISSTLSSSNGVCEYKIGCSLARVVYKIFKMRNEPDNALYNLSAFSWPGWKKKPLVGGFLFFVAEEVNLQMNQRMNNHVATVPMMAIMIILISLQFSTVASSCFSAHWWRQLHSSARNGFTDQSIHEQSSCNRADDGDGDHSDFFAVGYDPHVLLRIVGDDSVSWS